MNENMIPTLRVTTIVLLLCGSEAYAQEKSKGASSWRPYTDGPLTIEDFRGRPPAFRKPDDPNFGKAILAYTMTELQYQTTYRVSGSDSRWTAKFLTIECNSAVNRDQSWNLRPHDEYLLDHEQGHFDVAETFALKLKMELDHKLLRGQLKSTSGKTSEEAASRLHESLRKEVQPMFDDHVQAQMDYDRVTENGTNRTVQAEQRRIQKLTLDELRKKVPRGQ